MFENTQVKPGDKRNWISPSGTYVYQIWVVCSQCGKGRWVFMSSMRKKTFTGRCLTCNGKQVGKTNEGLRNSKIDIGEVKRLYYDEGLSQIAIAERFGVTTVAIYYIMKVHKLKARSTSEAMLLVSAKRPKVKDRIYKVCPRCHELKPIKEFYQSVATPDGRRVYCKKCCQESNLRTYDKHYSGLSKRPFPLDGSCELCNQILTPGYCYHHFDDSNPSLGIYACGRCDFLAEGLDEIDKNPWKVDAYRRLKEEVEEVEKTYIYLGPFSPLDNNYRLFLDGKQTHKWCRHCGRMLQVSKFYKGYNNYDGLQNWCKECYQKTHLVTREGWYNGLHKRPKPDCCELCGGKIYLGYHHWDDANKSKGVYVCHTNKCHNLAEVVDELDNGSLLPEKYSKLKQRIIELEAEKTLPLKQLNLVSQ